MYSLSKALTKKIVSTGVLLAWSVCGVLFATGMQEESRVLRIGTLNRVEAPHVFGDYYLGIFTKISNPPLMTMDGDGKLVGSTASGYTVSADHRTWTFTLKDDFYWSDGERVTAEDVAFSIAYTGERNPSAGWIGDTLVEARVIDDSTVEFEFSKPYTNLNLEFTSYNILPRHVWSRVASPLSYEAEDSFVGHGPFVLESVDLNAGLLSFVSNPYWKGHTPAFDRVEIRMFKNIDVLSLALERGDVDVFYSYAASYPYQYLQRLQENQEFSFQTILNQGLVFLGINLTRSPMDDPLVRKAIAAAIDYDELVRIDAMGYGRVPSRGFVPPSMGGFIETDQMRYDPDLAHTLLSQAGKVGSTVTLLVRDAYVRPAELVREYLEEAGLVVETKLVDTGTWFEEKDEYRYDLTITRSTPWGMLMHAGWGTGYLDSRRTGKGVLHNLDDERFHTLCDEILATTDTERIEALAAEVQRYYAENLPVIPLYWNEIVTPYRNDWEGWKPSSLFGIYTLESLLQVQPGS